MQNEYITLTEAARRSPGHPHMASVWRWCRRGVKTRGGGRVTLEHIRAGGKIFTTEAALRKFFESVAQADAKYFQGDVPSPEKPPTTVQRDRSIAQAEKVLHKGGIL